MKKVFIPLLAAASYLTLASHAFALNLCPSGFSSNLCNSTNSNQIQSVIATAINFIFVGVTIIALLFLIWGGFKWITSQGDKAKVEEARQHIINALIGLVLVFLSYIILNIVLAFFGTSLSNINFPSL